MKVKLGLVFIMFAVLYVVPALAQYDLGNTCWKCPVCGYTVSITPYQLTTANPYNLCPICHLAYAFQFIQVLCQAATGYTQTGNSGPIDIGSTSSSSPSTVQSVDSRPAIEDGQSTRSDTEYGTVEQQSAQDWFDKGNDLYDQGNYEGAIQAFDRAIEIDPQNAESGWYNKGNALNKLDKLDEAILAYNKAIKIEPLYADAWYNMGVALSQQDRYDEALEAYDSAIMADPLYAEDANFWYEKGNVLYKLDKFDEALMAYDSSIEIDPRHADVWYNKGFALTALGRTTEADAAFAKAKERGYEG
jgi:Tfp pilus assembly protein PilF